MEQNTKITLWGLGILIYKNVNKKPNNTSLPLIVEGDIQENNLLKIDVLKNQITQIDSQLNSSEMKNKWSQDDYVALQNTRRGYTSQLEKLGWKSITNQQKDGSFLQLFVKI